MLFRGRIVSALSGVVLVFASDETNRTANDTIYQIRTLWNLPPVSFVLTIEG
jgi:hypothetical protein